MTPTVANMQPNTTLPQEMSSFGDLGYDILTMSGVGRSETTVRFTVPPGFVTDEDAYLDLTFNHSGLLDFNRSGLTIFMNDNLIGSLLLTEQTAATNTQRIKMPSSSLTTNTNELKFEVDLAPLSQCSFIDTSNLWFSILPESVMNLPLKLAAADQEAPRDLSSYPYPFTGQPTLSNLAFVLPRNDPASWDVALDLIARRFTAIRAAHGPDAIAGISSARCTNEENNLMQKLMRAVVGTNNIDGCARVCHAPTAFGMQQTFGTGAATNSIDEFPLADCLMATLFNNRGPVLGISILVAWMGPMPFLTQTIQNYMPWMMEILPWRLIAMVGSEAPLAGYLVLDAPLPTVLPIIATVLWCVLGVGVAIWRIRREEF